MFNGVNMNEELWNVTMQIVPCFILGLGMGISKYFNEFSNPELKPNFRRFLGVFLSAGCVSIMAFAFINEVANFEYMTELGFCCFVAFFGVEKAVELGKKIIDIIRGNK